MISVEMKAKQITIKVMPYNSDKVDPKLISATLRSSGNLKITYFNRFAF